MLCNWISCFQSIISVALGPGVHYKILPNYSLGTGESYGPTAQHTQNFVIFFIQLNYVHKNKNKVLLPYSKLPCHEVAQHWEFHFLFLNSTILLSCNFGQSYLYLLNSPSILATHQLFLLDCVGLYL